MVSSWVVWVHLLPAYEERRSEPAEKRHHCLVWVAGIHGPTCVWERCAPRGKAVGARA